VKNSLLLLVAFALSVWSFAQTNNNKLPPYQRFPTLPPIQILLSDSVTTYTRAQIPTGKQVLLIIFSPDCSHCQDETTQMIAHMDELKDVQIIMITYHPISMMKEFIEKYGLEKYSNIVVGKDVQYFTTGFYDVRNIPCMVLYSKNGKLIGKSDGTYPIEEVIRAFEKSLN
jgi:thioredoxin-related protein